MIDSPSRRRVAVLLAFILATAANIVGVPSAQALTVDTMSQTGYYDIHGDFILVGNGVLTATANNIAGYPPSTLFSGSTTANTANDLYNMKYTGAGTGLFNSSTASYTIPQGAKVVAAKVIWGGNTGGAVGYSGTTCTADSARPATLPPSPGTSSPSTQKITVGLNGATSTFAPSSYTTDTGRGLPVGQSYYYSANADVSGMFAGVVGDGVAKTISVGNVWAAQGYGCMGGWSLELVYDFGAYDDGQPAASQRRAVYVFDGYERKFSGDPATTIDLTGLQPQGSGAKIGTVAFEGDASIAGDTISYYDTTSPLTEIANPTTGKTGNYFVGQATGATNYSGAAQTTTSGCSKKR